MLAQLGYATTALVPGTGLGCLFGYAPATTQIYLHADMSHKQRAIERTRPLGVKLGRYRPCDTMLAFLQAL